MKAHTSVQRALQNAGLDHEIDALLFGEFRQDVVEFSENEFRVKLFFVIEVPLEFNNMAVTFDCKQRPIDITKRAHKARSEDTQHAQLVHSDPRFNELPHPPDVLRPDVPFALCFLALFINAAPVIHDLFIHCVKQLLQRGVLRLARGQGTRLVDPRAAQLFNQHARRFLDGQILVRLDRSLLVLLELVFLRLEVDFLSQIRFGLVCAGRFERTHFLFQLGDLSRFARTFHAPLLACCGCRFAGI